ncbi:S-layer region-like protein [Nostoc sp. HK-01]|nr:S-layer region-like protein [Nostoc sp. HK-01]
MLGIVFGLLPRITNSNVCKERDNSYHIQAFYRWRMNTNILVTPGF